MHPNCRKSTKRELVNDPTRLNSPLGLIVIAETVTDGPQDLILRLRLLEPVKQVPAIAHEDTLRRVLSRCDPLAGVNWQG